MSRARLALATVFLAAFAAPAAAGDKSDPQCASYGEGYVYVPSIGSCIRVSGEVRGDYVTGHRGKGRSGFGNNAPTTFDSRTGTETGPFGVPEPRQRRN